MYPTNLILYWTENTKRQKMAQMTPNINHPDPPSSASNPQNLAHDTTRAAMTAATQLIGKSIGHADTITGTTIVAPAAPQSAKRPRTNHFSGPLVVAAPYPPTQHSVSLCSML
jgi:hypothetical protein